MHTHATGSTQLLILAEELRVSRDVGASRHHVHFQVIYLYIYDILSVCHFF